ncbi:predicted protein [Streptomyces sp. C]|nr:predicted protein [Streptomyces sp. C]
MPPAGTARTACPTAPPAAGPRQARATRLTAPITPPTAGPRPVPARAARPTAPVAPPTGSAAGTCPRGRSGPGPVAPVRVGAARRATPRRSRASVGAGSARSAVHPGPQGHRTIWEAS